MKLYVVPGKLAGGDESTSPYRVYLIAAQSAESALKALPANFERIGPFGEAAGSIEHPVGVIGHLDSSSEIKVKGYQE
jgi:hypothetical protein